MSEVAVIDYNAEAFRGVVHAILTESNSNAVCVLRALQGANSQETANTLEEIGREGGEADVLSEKLADRSFSHSYAHDIARRFAPFAGLLREVIPHCFWRRNATNHQPLTVAEFSRELHERMAKEEAREMRHGVTYARAAELLHIGRDMVRHYVSIGYLEPVYVRGEKNAFLVNRKSVNACKLYLAGARFEKGGAVVAPGAWIGRDEVCRIVGRAISAVNAYANEGRIVRVYNRPGAAGGQCCGYTRASAEALARELAAGGVYFTTSGKIVAAERVSREEAARIIGRGNKFLAACANVGKLERVYRGPDLKRPDGYTRTSVVAVAQEYHPDVRARAAVAVPGFMIEELPPPTRPRRLMAAKLSPAEPEAPKHPAATTKLDPQKLQAVQPQTQTLEPPKRRPEQFVFRLIDTSRKDTPMDNIPENENQVPKEAAQLAERSGKDFGIAKGFIIHEDGIIRAVCVSEDDRDEIVAALRFYRETKGRQSEIESALSFMDMAKATLGIAAPAETKAEPLAGEGHATETGAKE